MDKGTCILLLYGEQCLCKFARKTSCSILIEKWTFLLKEMPSMATLDSTSLPNVACVTSCNSAMAFSNVICKVEQNIDRNE